jgi:hypothetical protein
MMMAEIKSTMDINRVDIQSNKKDNLRHNDQEEKRLRDKWILKENKEVKKASRSISTLKNKKIRNHDR